MKKRYLISIMFIGTLMIFSVFIYASNYFWGEIDLNNIILNGLYASGTVFDADGQNEILNNLSTSNFRESKSTSYFAQISSGFESLSTPSERVCYNLIKNNCRIVSSRAGSDGLYPIEPMNVQGSRLTTTQIKKVLYAVQNDHPEFFWISGNFSYRYFSGGTIIKLNSIFSEENRNIAERKLNEKINQIKIKISSNELSDYDKELFIHDFIIDNCKYEENYASAHDPKIFTSYGCLVNGKAVCEGYAKAAQLVLCSCGVECRTIVGARGKEPHMWNIVKINGDWYHLDITWDGSGDLQKYYYFNLSDEIIKKDHIINEQISSNRKFEDDVRLNFVLPTCTSMAQNYFEKNAVKINNFDNSSEDTVIKRLRVLAINKFPYLYISIDKNLDFDSAKNQLLNQKPYKLFNYIFQANKSLGTSHKINAKRVKYAENKNQNILIISLEYI